MGSAKSHGFRKDPNLEGRVAQIENPNLGSKLPSNRAEASFRTPGKCCRIGTWSAVACYRFFPRKLASATIRLSNSSLTQLSRLRLNHLKKQARRLWREQISCRLRNAG
jgi:hypothetical protein